MASEQIAALTKTLTESLVAQQKAQIDFQKQMLVQQERFEALVMQQTTNNRLFCETILSQKTNDNASRFFSAEGIANSLAEFKYDAERGDTFPPIVGGSRRFLQKDVRNGLTKKKSHSYFRNWVRRKIQNLQIWFCQRNQKIFLFQNC